MEDLMKKADFKTLTKDFSLRQDEDVFSIENYTLLGQTKPARQYNNGIFSLDDPFDSSKSDMKSEQGLNIIGANFVGHSFVWLLKF